jgi:hypothetical protein
MSRVALGVLSTRNFVQLLTRSPPRQIMPLGIRRVSKLIEIGCAIGVSSEKRLGRVVGLTVAATAAVRRTHLNNGNIRTTGMNLERVSLRSAPFQPSGRGRQVIRQS